MSTVTFTPGDAERKACLEWLGREWDSLGAEKWQMLATWAHPDLPPGRRDALAGDYAEALMLADGLAAGWVSWDQVEPELTCAGRQDEAAQRVLDRADDLLLTLLDGEAGQ